MQASRVSRAEERLRWRLAWFIPSFFLKLTLRLYEKAGRSACRDPGCSIHSSLAVMNLNLPQRERFEIQTCSNTERKTHYRTENF